MSDAAAIDADEVRRRRESFQFGYLPPAEFEERYYREQPLVEDEGLKQLSLQ